MGLSNVSNSEGVETHLKLATQKWKAKCKHSKHEQSWTDENVSTGTSPSDLFLVIPLKLYFNSIQKASVVLLNQYNSVLTSHFSVEATLVYVC